MVSWGFLTNHARVLLCIARDPGVRLRDIASSLGITERSAHGFVTDLTAAGYVVKQKNGRRNRYQIQARLPPLRGQDLNGGSAAAGLRDTARRGGRSAGSRPLRSRTGKARPAVRITTDPVSMRGGAR